LSKEEVIEFSPFTVELFGAVITALLAIIAYFVKSQVKEQKEFIRSNSAEHKEINRSLTIAQEKINQIAKNEKSINILDKRVDKHDIVINNLKTRIEQGRNNA
jgi:Na+-translocating ferredoxin:NAD+ oxidoreductase RnfG subunit